MRAYGVLRVRVRVRAVKGEEWGPAEVPNAREDADAQQETIQLGDER